MGGERESRSGRITKWEDGMVATIFIRTWREGQAKGEKSNTGSEQWIKDESEESRVNLLRSRCFVVLFFFCWHSEHGGSRQRFFIGHMPLHNDLWMQALCRLILLSTHYVAQPTVTIWGREEASPSHSFFNHLSSLLLSCPSCHSLYILFLRNFSLFPSLSLRLKAF